MSARTRAAFHWRPKPTNHNTSRNTFLNIQYFTCELVAGEDLIFVSRIRYGYRSFRLVSPSARRMTREKDSSK
jgi:hypothetical protein